jgi:polysaccharide biosynthesis/export protein
MRNGSRKRSVRGKFPTAGVFLLLLALLGPTGARSQSEEVPPEVVRALTEYAGPDRPSGAFHERHPRYRIGAGDVLELTFRLSPEFDQSVSVQPDGFISLREAGDVHIQGQTTAEVVKTIREAYADILREPIVSVTLKQFHQPFFVAGGELKRPGKYDLRDATTVVQAVALAGGFTDAAKHSQVYLFRRADGDAVEVKQVNVKQMLSRADLEEDIHLRPGDILWVPQNTLSKIKGFILPRATIGPTVRPGP